MADMEFITRTANWDGWRVYIARGAFKRVRYFGDTRHRGRDGALAAAVRYRNQQRRLMPALVKRAQSPGPGRIFREERSYRDSTGTPLVYEAWSAWIKMGGGRIASTSYSIPKWGERAAKERALAYLNDRRVERAASGARR